MSLEQTLDLIGIGWPICLLECKNELNELAADHKLEVKVRDPDVLKDLLTIIERSGDFTVSHQREGGHFRIHIRKQVCKHGCTAASKHQRMKPPVTRRGNGT